MAEAPSSTSAGTSVDTGSSEPAPAPAVTETEETVDSADPEAATSEAAATEGASAETVSVETPAAPATKASKAPKDPIKEVLDGPTLGGIMNTDAKSTVFVLDQNYIAVGDNGLTAKFTFNPTKAVVFSNVLVEITLEDLVFDFRPTKPSLIEGKTPEGLDVYIFTGTAPYLFDEFGKKWDQTASKNATFKLEVIMEAGGTGVKEIRLALVFG
jgi:hypothetical protein